MDVFEARRTAVAVVRALLLGDGQASAVLLDALLDDEDAVAQLMVLTSLADIAAAALARNRDASLHLLDQLTAQAEAWPADRPIPWPDAP